MAGTTYVWTTATNGDWWSGTNWNIPGSFPYTDDTADLSVGGAAFTVTMEDGTIQTSGGGSLTITGYTVGNLKLGTNATLLALTSNLDIQYGAANSGTIIADYGLQVGYTTANAVVSFTSLTGATGHIVLNGATGATLSGHAAGIEFDLQGQSLEGSGTVQQLKLKVFDTSRINANVNGQTLTLTTGDDILNNGLLEATNGGTLTISNSAIRQAPFMSGNLNGIINASDKSKVYLASDTVYGGTISESGSGQVTLSDYNNVFDGSTSAGAVTFTQGMDSGGYSFVLNGAIHNQGVLTPEGNQILIGAANVTLDSGGASTKGQIKLIGGDLNSMVGTPGGATLDNVDNQILGYGAIYNLDFTNESGGVVNANVNGQSLNIDGSVSLTNHGLLTASNGGILQITSQTLDASAGSVLTTTAATSAINIGSDTFLGGQQSANFHFIDHNNVFDGSTGAGAVTFTKSLSTGGYNLLLKGAIHNDGQLTTNGGTLNIDATGVTLDSAGGVPANSFVNLISGNINSTAGTTASAALDVASSSIRGYGAIYNLNLTIEYGSYINANVSGQTLSVDGSDVLVNKGTLEATNGGSLAISSQTLTYQTGVSYLAATESKFVIASDTFRGGQFTTGGTGAFVFSDHNNVFDGSTSAGAVTFSQAMNTGGYNATAVGILHNKGAFSLGAGTLEIGSPGLMLDSGGASVKGQVVLTGGAINSVAGTTASAILDDVDNQIGGYGALYNLQLIVESGAKINANVAGQTLSIDGSDTLNNGGLVEATNGGTLSLTSQTLAYQSGSSLAAVGAGSKIVLASDTFQGGSLIATTGGAFAFSDHNNVFDGSTAAGAVTFGQAMNTGGYNVAFKGTIHNKGAFSLKAGTLNVAGATLDSGGAATKGQIVIAGGALNSVAGTAQSGALDNIDNQINGYGALYNLNLTNEIGGVVNANAAAQTLTIDGSDAVTNKGLLEATAGFLSLSGAINNAGGTILANGGEVDLRSEHIIRGTLQGAGAAGVHIADSNVLLDAGNVANGLSLLGNVFVNAGLTLTLDGSVVNKGLLKLGANSALTLGDTAGTAATLTNVAGAVLNIAGNDNVTLGASTASKIVNAGLIQKSTGVGISVISVSVSGAGGIEVDAGLLDLKGPANVLSGALTGAGKIEFSGGGSTALASGATASVAGIMLADSGTTLRLQTSLSYAGAFTQAAGTTLTMLPGITFTLTGTSSIGGTIFGSANLAMTGGSATWLATGAITTTTWTSMGTALTFTGPHTYAGGFSAASEAITLNGLAKLTGAATLSGVTLKGANQLQFGKSATLSGGDVLGGTTSIANFGTVTQNGGDVTLGDSSGGVAKIINSGAAATWSFADDSGVALGNSAASSIANTGLIQKTGGGGVSAIAAAVVNSGTLESSSGTLDLKTAVTGKGSVLISGAAKVEFDGPVAATQTVSFQGAGGVLDLTNWGTFSAPISGFDTGSASGDEIDVSGPWSWVGFNQSSGMMTFAEGAAQHSVKLTGSYIAANFHEQAIGGVTHVTYG